MILLKLWVLFHCPEQPEKSSHTKYWLTVYGFLKFKLLKKLGTDTKIRQVKYIGLCKTSNFSSSLSVNASDLKFCTRSLQQLCISHDEV